MLKASIRLYLSYRYIHTTRPYIDDISGAYFSCESEKITYDSSVFYAVLFVIPHTIGPSPLHGTGAFAGINIPSGTVVCRYVEGFDSRYTDEMIAQLPPMAQDFINNYAYRNIATGVITLDGDHERFMNHSKTPNVICSSDECGECMIAACDISSGQELTCDYETFDADYPLYCNDY